MGVCLCVCVCVRVFTHACVICSGMLIVSSFCHVISLLHALAHAHPIPNFKQEFIAKKNPEKKQPPLAEGTGTHSNASSLSSSMSYSFQFMNMTVYSTGQKS